jgi:hypothetical protein
MRLQALSALMSHSPHKVDSAIPSEPFKIVIILDITALLKNEIHRQR